MDPDPSHTLPTALAAQTNSPSRVQESSSSMASEHADGGGRPQTYSSDNPLDSSSESPRGNNSHRNFSRDIQFPQTAQSKEGYRSRLVYHPGHHLPESLVPLVPEKPPLGSGVPNEKRRSWWPFMQTEDPVIREECVHGTFRARLQETVSAAERERDESVRRVTRNTWLLNIAIVLQVLFGALTTGLSSTLSAKQIGVAIPVLGGMSTAVAAYVAQARGSGEPDVSKVHVKKINQFLRECRAFTDDHGDDKSTGADDPMNKRLEELRKRFEELLGNTDGQGKALSRILVDTGSDGDTKKQMVRQ